MYEIAVNGNIAYTCHSELERVEVIGHLIELGIDFIIHDVLGLHI
jgi:hypothetical protein